MSLSPHVPASSADAAAGGVDLAVLLGPLHLAHPIINASGTMEIFDLAEVFGEEILERPPVAAYVPKTVTVEARDGNSAPRILETAGGMINAIGLSGEGIEAFIRDRLPRLLRLPCPLIVSVGGFSVDEYTLLASRLREALEDAQGSDWPTKAGLELNISCPNVHSGCVSIGSDPKETYEVVSAVRAVWPGLLVAKLTPNVADISAIGRVAETAGADAIAAVNTFKGLVIDRADAETLPGQHHRRIVGTGYQASGATRGLRALQSVSVPIVAMGGIATVQDVLEFMSCGAQVVAVGSAAFREPGLAGRLASRSRGRHWQVGNAPRQPSADLPTAPAENGHSRPFFPAFDVRRKRVASGNVVCIMAPVNQPMSIVPQTPERSQQQRMEALRRANDIRSERARLKEALRNGDVAITDVLSDPPACVATAKVLDLVLAVPKYGRVKANKLLERCRVSSSKTVNGLTPRQRKELLDMLSS